MRQIGKETLLLIRACLTVLLLVSSAAWSETPPISVELVSDRLEVVPGETVSVALRIQHKEGWHTYWQNAGDNGFATKIKWQLPEGAEASDILWPYPERQPFFNMMNYGYSDEVFLFTNITVPSDISPGTTFQLGGKASWLSCKEKCLPGDAQVQISFPVVADNPQSDDSWSTVLASAKAKVPGNDSLQALLSDISGKLSLEIPATEFDSSATVSFFPVTKQIVDNVPEPEIRWSDDRLVVELPKAEETAVAPELFEGVLVVADNGDSHVIHVSASASADVAPPAQWSSIIWMMLVAAGGGLILNLMPCVLPVLSIKILSVVEGGGHDQKQKRRHSQFYTLGVVLSYLALAGVLIVLRAAGEGIGWGFQLQSPIFITLLIFLLFIMGLSLSGLFEFGTSLQGIGSSLGAKSGYQGSFYTGVLATVVATPCGAPLVSPAIAFALTQSPLVTLLVFAAMGFGLALPFLLISYSPKLARSIPKPGHWMETFKQVLAFPLYLTVVGLIYVLASQTDLLALTSVLAAMVLVAFALWLWKGSTKNYGKIAAASVMAVSLAAPIWWLSQAGGKETEHYQAYSPEKLSQSLDSGKPVFVNMTAAWCGTCKVNEWNALSDSEVVKQFKENGVIYLKGDWTNRDEQILNYLKSFNRFDVPLYVMYVPGKEPQVLSEGLITASEVLQALEGG